MTVAAENDLEDAVDGTACDFLSDSAVTCEEFTESSMTVVALDDPDDPAAGSPRDFWLCERVLNDLELALAERRENAVDDGEDFDIRRTSTMTKTLKKSAASGTTRKITISVVHDQTEKNVVASCTSHPAAASYDQKYPLTTSTHRRSALLQTSV